MIVTAKICRTDDVIVEVVSRYTVDEWRRIRTAIDKTENFSNTAADFAYAIRNATARLEQVITADLTEKEEA